MPQVETTCWGREVMLPADEWGSFDGGPDAWVSRLAVPDPEEAITLAAKELCVEREYLELRPILMREESEVDARINGHEFPHWVPCTRRARAYEPFWRVEIMEESVEKKPTVSCPTCGNGPDVIQPRRRNKESASGWSPCPDSWHEEKGDEAK